MAAVKGKSGSITIAAGAVGKITNYELNYSDTIIDKTGFDSTARELEALGLATAALSVDVIFDSADTGQDSLRAACGTGASVAVVLYPEGNTTGKMKLTGTMYIESAKFASGSLEGMVTASFSLKAGALTEATV